jgi:two-component system, cell cycle response regulator DivK
MLTILLVEPHVDTRELYQEYLQREGFSVTSCDNTDAAFRQARGTDCLVTGIRVNGTEDGLGLVRRLRSCTETESLPIIVLSACAFESDEREAMAAGCTAYLSKPCLPLRLADVIRSALGEKAHSQGRMAKVAHIDQHRRRKRA